jgi:hypothetical protein
MFKNCSLIIDLLSVISLNIRDIISKTDKILNSNGNGRFEVDRLASIIPRIYQNVVNPKKTKYEKRIVNNVVEEYHHGSSSNIIESFIDNNIIKLKTRKERTDNNKLNDIGKKILEMKIK